MTKRTYRTTQSILALVTLFVLLASFHFQYVIGMQPCPLCLMQRICVFILLALTGLTLATQKKAHAVILIQIIISCAGLFFASRQLWLQSLPLDSAPACMPGLDVLIRYFPWKSVVHALFWGTGECAADSGWSFLGINMPGWTALYFLFMIVASCILYISLKKTVTDGN